MSPIGMGFTLSPFKNEGSKPSRVAVCTFFVPNPQFGTRWITNGTKNQKIIKGDIIPRGWELGRVF